MQTTKPDKPMMLVQASARLTNGRACASVFNSANPVKALIDSLGRGIDFLDVVIDGMDADMDMDVPVIIIVELDGVLHTYVFETRGENDDARAASEMAAEFLTRMGDAKTVRCWVTPVVATYIAPEGT